MKPVLFLAGVLALAAAPALTQTPAADPGPAPGPSPPPSNYMSNSGPSDLGSQYRLEDPRKQCFDGRFLVGTNRAGDRTVYVQAKTRGVFRLDLAAACDALKVAERVSVRANGSYAVCPGQAATLVVKTAAGPKRCSVGEVRHLNPAEVAELAPVARGSPLTPTELAELSRAGRR